LVQIGSGSFNQQAKKVRKTRKPLISTFLRLLFDFISLKTDVNVNVSDPDYMRPDLDPMSPDSDPAKYQSGSGTRVLMSKY
jgi:hypothetical protein